MFFPKPFKRSSFLRSLLFISITFAFNQAYAIRILIDPGHGGRDKGALQGNYSESDIVWAWSLELKKLLLDQNFEVEMTRNETAGLALHNRVSKLNQKKYDLILSLHANYILDARIKGIEYYVTTPLDLEDQKLQLAHEETQLKSGQKKTKASLGSLNEEQKSQVSAIINDLERQSRLEQSLKIADQLNKSWSGKVKQGPFDLLAQADSPAVLVELGYLSNPADLKNLLDAKYRFEKNLKIAEAISQYFKNQKSDSRLRF
jgi:N-acetylmuramoyl-L-alanine amidase